MTDRNAYVSVHSIVGRIAFYSFIASAVLGLVDMMWLKMQRRSPHPPLNLQRTIHGLTLQPTSSLEGGYNQDGTAMQVLSSSAIATSNGSEENLPDKDGQAVAMASSPAPTTGFACPGNGEHATSTSFCRSRWNARCLHVFFGYVSWLTGFVSIFIGILSTIRPLQLFYFLWTSATAGIIALTVLYRYRFLHRFVPGFTWFDRRFHHLKLEYQTLVRVRRKVDEHPFGEVVVENADNITEEVSVSTTGAGVGGPCHLNRISSSAGASRSARFASDHPSSHDVPSAISASGHARPGPQRPIDEPVDDDYAAYIQQGELLSRLTARYHNMSDDEESEGRSRMATLRGAAGRFAPIQQMLGFRRKPTVMRTVSSESAHAVVTSAAGGGHAALRAIATLPANAITDVGVAPTGRVDPNYAVQKQSPSL